MARPLAAPPEVLPSALARGFAAAGPRAFGPGDVASGRAGTRTVLGRSCSETSHALTPRACWALAARIIRNGGGDAACFGTHSVRRGAAAAAAVLLHVGVPSPLVTQAHRHASPRPEQIS